MTMVLQGLAVIGLMVGIRQTGVGDFTGLSQLLNPSSAAPHRMVTSGLYAWVRHPLYFFGLVFIWLTPVLTWNILALNTGATVYLFTGAWFEERKLLVEFGERYAVYRQKTAMMIPGLKLNSK
jgi:protein-S-isoprenylcysteine O-methyltransferase Ste14